ncbi:11075_t:CDS:2, partial [Cetraspora pellucida]
LFPEIVNVINKYLTEPIANAIKIEMLQYLFISAKKIEPIIEELHNEQEDALEIWKITDIRSEKRHHVHFVVVVNAVSFLCSMIPHRWYKDHYQDDSIPDNPIFNYEMSIFNDKNILPIRKPAMIPTTIPTLKKSTTDKISNNICEVQTDQSSDESEESEIKHEEDIEESLKSIKNPNKVNIKGRPPKR